MLQQQQQQQCHKEHMLGQTDGRTHGILCSWPSIIFAGHVRRAGVSGRWGEMEGDKEAGVLAAQLNYSL